MKKCLNNRAKHENLIYRVFFLKTGLIGTKNALEIILYFASAPYWTIR